LQLLLIITQLTPASFVFNCFVRTAAASQLPGAGGKRRGAAIRQLPLIDTQLPPRRQASLAYNCFRFSVSCAPNLPLRIVAAKAKPLRGGRCVFMEAGPRRPIAAVTCPLDPTSSLFRSLLRGCVLRAGDHDKERFDEAHSNYPTEASFRW